MPLNSTNKRKIIGAQILDSQKLVGTPHDIEKICKFNQ